MSRINSINFCLPPTALNPSRWLRTGALATIVSWQPAASAAIYGEDSRTSSLASGHPAIVEESRESVAVMVRRSAIIGSGLPEGRNADQQDLPQVVTDWRRLSGSTLGRRMNLCPGERFADEPAPGFCTAFLVGESVMATAGHCIRSAVDCAHIAVVFGFESAPASENTSVGESWDDAAMVRRSNVYFCREILARRQDPVTGADFALFEVDRAVQGRTPLLMRRSGRLLGHETLILLGHPGGIPMKVAGDGTIRDNNPEGYFVAELDTGGGSSGSPVMSLETGIVEGIVVRGERGYEAKGECWINRRCDAETCRGEDVTRASIVAPLLP